MMREADRTVSEPRLYAAPVNLLATMSINQHNLSIIEITVNYCSVHNVLSLASIATTRLLYVFIYSLSFCTSCTISIINKKIATIMQVF